MSNIFNGCKTLGDLYEVFVYNPDLTFEITTDAELNRLADVFEANVSPVDMVDTPLGETEFNHIRDFVISKINDAIEDANETIINDSMEDEDMKENTTNTNATINEEVTMGEKAKAFAEASKEKLANGFKAIVENVDVAADEVKKMADMNSNQLEDYLKENGKSIFDKIIGAVKNYSDDLKAKSDMFPALGKASKKYDNIINLIKDVLDEKELSGWGKFKAIVKELINWLVRLFFKVGAIVLKLAFTVVVGAIKIGAIALVTAGKVVNVANKEIVKPGVKAGKKAWAKHKENVETRKAEKAAKEAEDDYFFDDEDDFDDIAEELDLV